MRQAISTSMLVVPSIGNCTRDQMIDMISSVRLASMRLVTKPTVTADTANRKKNDEPTQPNCRGVRCSSSIIGGPTMLSTTLSAKLISMKRKSRAVMPHAPFSGRSCTVTLASTPTAPFCRACLSHKTRLAGGTQEELPTYCAQQNAWGEKRYGGQ